MKWYSPYQFSLFRLLLGVYCMVHFGLLIPYADELWSCQGVLPANSLNFTYGIFPSLLDVYDSPEFTKIFVAVLMFFSLLFTIGYRRQIVSAFLWYGWVCLFDRNNLISNPGIPFVGWILLCCIFIPSGEPLSLFTPKKTNWEFPKIIFSGAWVIMALSYTISGIDKLNSPSWRDGTAIIHLLNNPLARNLPTRDFFLSLPPAILHFLTWSILFIEIAFAPLSIWVKSRKWIWLAMIFMHLGILLIVDFADLTLGMLMIHWFTFDARWLKPSFPQAKNQMVFFDGVCGLCNSFIDMLLKEDRRDVLVFAPLQGETAKKYLPEISTTKMKTVVFFRDGVVFQQSDAVIEIGKSLGGLFKLLILLKIFPKFIRDFFYSIIADNRYKWFGKKESCRMPTKNERGKLLY